MFWENGIYTDMNEDGKRNIGNADKDYYNCGGYALQTFNWYLPYNHKTLPHFDGSLLTAEMVITTIESEVKWIRHIDSEDDLLPGECLVLFRWCEFDFHFVRRASNGIYYHKRGEFRKIEVMGKKEVYSNMWCKRYNSEIILFASRF